VNSIRAEGRVVGHDITFCGMCHHKLEHCVCAGARRWLGKELALARRRERLWKKRRALIRKLLYRGGDQDNEIHTLLDMRRRVRR
jgi:hypothetical protein